MPQGLGLQGGFGAGSAVDELRRLVAERFREQQEQNQVREAEARRLESARQFDTGLTHRSSEAQKERGHDVTLLDLSQAFRRGESEEDRKFRTGERVESQLFQTGERLGGQEFRTGERVSGQAFQTGERLGGQQFQTGERLGGQQFRTGERLGSQKHELDLADITGDQRMKQIREGGLYDLASAQFRTGLRPATGEQEKTRDFYTRMRSALDDMDRLESQLNEKDVGIIQSSPLPEAVNNMLLSSAGQQYAQAIRAYTLAKLRRESGAAISAGEFEKEGLVAARSVGDTTDTLAQKRRTREGVAEGFAGASGKAFEDFYGRPFERNAGAAAGGGAGGNAGPAKVGEQRLFPDGSIRTWDGKGWK